jgi:thioredoxin-dependent peroxiredoxin
VQPRKPCRLLAGPVAFVRIDSMIEQDHSVCETYGVWVEKSMYGRTYWGALRSTFLIDEDGVVQHVIPKASPKTHDDEVLAALGEMAAAG